NSEGGGGPNLALHAHAGFGKAEVQRLLGLGAKVAIDSDEVAGARSFAGDDDWIVAQAGLEGEFGGLERGEEHALVDDFLGLFADISVGVLLHFPHSRSLI